MSNTFIKNKFFYPFTLVILTLTTLISMSYNLNAKQSNNNLTNFNQESISQQPQNIADIHSNNYDSRLLLNLDQLSGVSISIGSRTGFKITVKPNTKYPISAKEAIKIATRIIKGNVLKVKLIDGKYKINILTKKGLVICYVSATTGKIIDIK